MSIQLVLVYACVVGLVSAAPIPAAHDPIDDQSIWCLQNFPSRILACLTNNVHKIPYLGGNADADENYSPLNALNEIDVKIGRPSIFGEKKHLKIGRDKRSPMKKHKDHRRPGNPRHGHMSKERRKPPHSRERRKHKHSKENTSSEDSTTAPESSEEGSGEEKSKECRSKERGRHSKERGGTGSRGGSTVKGMAEASTDTLTAKKAARKAVKRQLL